MVAAGARGAGPRERRTGVAAPPAHERQQREEERDGEREGAGERGDGAVDAHLVQPRQRQDVARGERPHDGAGAGDTGGAAGGREDRRLGDERPHQVKPLRPQRRAHRELLLPVLAADEEEVGDVGAGDEQQQRHGGQQQPERAPRFADHGIAERRHHRAQPGVGEDLPA